MDINAITKTAHRIARRYRVSDGKRFNLADWDPGCTGSLSSEDKPRAKEALAVGVEGLAELQSQLYAQNRWALLLIFQGMDAAGKDSAIRAVMSGVDPQGCQVHAFKAPNSEERDHDFMWRCMRHLPERGRIGIFNRSYYEEVLVVRVHPELLQSQQLPPELITPKIWQQRYQDIRHIERYLHRNGIVVCKFFLNLSRATQKERFLERLDNPEKHWKFAAADVTERGHWKAYQHAYEEAIRHTARSDAPWYIVPADNKWYSRIVIAAAITDTLQKLQLSWPRVNDAERAALERARAELSQEKR